MYMRRLHTCLHTAACLWQAGGCRADGGDSDDNQCGSAAASPNSDNFLKGGWGSAALWIVLTGVWSLEHFPWGYWMGGVPWPAQACLEETFSSTMKAGRQAPAYRQWPSPHIVPCFLSLSLPISLPMPCQCQQLTGSPHPSIPCPHHGFCPLPPTEAGCVEGMAANFNILAGLLAFLPSPYPSIHPRWAGASPEPGTSLSLSLFPTLPNPHFPTALLMYTTYLVFPSGFVTEYL